MTIPEIHSKNQSIFVEKLHRETFATNACNIFDKLTNGNINCVDCLGENFNSLINIVETQFFQSYKPEESTDLSFYFSTYNFWLNTFGERIEFIFKLINPKNENNLFTNFQKENFKTLSDIKKWMNFIKHPKDFLFCHWPEYTFEENSVPQGEKIIKIDINFVRNYYSKTDTRPQILENQDKVWVVIPNLVELTTDFCDELNTFFEFICENKVVSDYLKLKTTIENYYETVQSENEIT